MDRAARGRDRADGRQARRPPGRARGRGGAGAGDHRAGARCRRGGRLRRRARLAGGDQGGRRRRWPGDPGGARAGGGRRGAGRGQPRGGGCIRVGRLLPRAVLRAATSRGGAGAGRRPRRHRAARRARLLGAAPPPEADRGDTLAWPAGRDPRAPAHLGGGGRQGVRLRGRRHRRAALGPRDGRGLVPGDEHPAPGRAPDHRGGDRRGHRGRAVARRRRGAARVRSGAGPLRRPRHRVPHQRRGPGTRVPAEPGDDRQAALAGRSRRAGRRRLPERRHRVAVLRRPARQGDHLGARPRRGNRTDAGRARGPDGRGAADDRARARAGPRARRLPRRKALDHLAGIVRRPGGPRRARPASARGARARRRGPGRGPSAAWRWRWATTWRRARYWRWSRR